MAVQNLNDVLQGIVASIDGYATNNNYLVGVDGKVLKARGKDIYLWNDEMYHTPVDTFFCFNPFQELVTHEDSPSLVYLKKMLNSSLNQAIHATMLGVLNATLTIKTPNKRQLALMGDELKGVDKKTIDFLTSLTKVLKPSSRNRSLVDISIFTSHPITRDVDGLKYAGIRSPLLHALAYWNTGDKVFDVKPPSKKVVEQIRSALRTVLPKDFAEGIYFVGNKHSTIPRNKALHDLYADVIEHLNDVVSTLKLDVQIPEVHEDWTNGLSRISGLLNGIPRDVFGTIGDVRAGQEARAAEEPQARLNVGWGAAQAPAPTAATGIPQGGFAAMMSPQPGFGVPQSGMAAMMAGTVMNANVPAGYMLTPIPGAQQPQYDNGHGQPNQGGIPQGGMAAMMAGVAK